MALETSRPKNAWMILLIVYLVLLFFFGFLRSYDNGFHPSLNWAPFYAENRATGLWNINFMPLTFGFRQYLGTALGFTAGVDYDTAAVNIFGNLVKFLPLSFLLPLAFPGKTFGWVMRRCLLAAVAFEALQFVTLLGVFDVDDIWLNLLGCLAGYGAYALPARLVKRRAAPRDRPAVPCKKICEAR